MKVNEELNELALAVELRRLHNKLHAGARDGLRCECGGCRHQVLVSARRSGIAAEVIEAHLRPEPIRPQPRIGRAPKRRYMSARIAESMSVRAEGRLVRGPRAIETLLTSLHEGGR